MEQSINKPNEEEDLSNPERNQPSVSQDVILKNLTDAIAEEDVNGIKVNLDYIKENYPELEEDAKVEEAKELLKTLEELKKKVAVESLRQAVIQQNERKIRQKITFIEENYPELSKTTEVDEANQLLKRLQEEREARVAMKRLLQSLRSRDEKLIAPEVQHIKENFPDLCRTREFQDAEKLLKRLVADKEAFNQKMILERLRQAKLHQDEDRLRKELMEIEDNYGTLKKRPEVQDAEEWLRILEAARGLKESCKSRDKDAIRNALKEIEKDPSLKEPLKFLILEAKFILEELVKHKKPIQLKIDLPSLNEVRRYVVPPPGVLPVMQAVFLLLGYDEDQTKTWPQVQRLWIPTGPHNLYNQIVNFEVNKVHPMIAARARELILGEPEPPTKHEGDRSPIDEGNDEDEHENEDDDVNEEDLDQTDEPRDEMSTARARYRRDERFEAEDENYGYMTARRELGNHKAKAAAMKKRGIDFNKLRKSCPVARALLVWVMYVVRQVEDLEGPEAMVPARDVKQQKIIFGRYLPDIARKDRQYYHDLARTSVRRGYGEHQPPPKRIPYGETINGRKPFLQYKQLNGKLPHLMNPAGLMQTGYASSWPASADENAGYTRGRQLYRERPYRDSYYEPDRSRYGYHSRHDYDYDYEEESRMNYYT